jgi:hypothetical protein
MLQPEVYRHSTANASLRFEGPHTEHIPLHPLTHHKRSWSPQERKIRLDSDDEDDTNDTYSPEAPKLVFNLQRRCLKGCIERRLA